jgi:hypothetical protein
MRSGALPVRGVIGQAIGRTALASQRTGNRSRSSDLIARIERLEKAVLALYEHLLLDITDGVDIEGEPPGDAFDALVEAHPERASSQ